MDRESCFSIGIDDAQPGQHLNQLFNAMTLFLYTAKKNLHCSLVAMQLRLWNVCLLNEIRATAGNVCTNEVHWRNSPLIMSQCGSPINISSMCCWSTIPNGYIYRSLPHLTLDSKTAAALTVLSFRWPMT